MSSELVFLTGATGHVGFRVLLDTLALGYSARLAVRSEAKKNTVLNNPAFKALNAADRVSFVVVPDLTTPNAYDEAVKGADYIIHIASPLVNGELELDTDGYHKYYVQPAVRGTLSILESAKKEPSVKRVIITSSVVAIKTFMSLVSDPDLVTGADDRVPDDNGPYMNHMHAYSASKIAALNASDKWIKENKTSFDLVNVHPGFIEGRDDLILEAKAAFSGTNAVILSIASGKPYSETPIPGSSVYLGDVSKTHVGALNKAKIPAGSYIANWNPEGTFNGTKWEEVNSIVAKEFPEQVKAGVVKPTVEQQSIVTRFDSTKTEKVYGWKFQDLEAQVKSVVGHYVELSA
jgi:nucleoside-diphosphate-sugar epimerase